MGSVGESLDLSNSITHYDGTTRGYVQDDDIQMGYTDGMCIRKSGGGGEFYGD